MIHGSKIAFPINRIGHSKAVRGIQLSDNQRHKHLANNACLKVTTRFTRQLLTRSSQTSLGILPRSILQSHVSLCAYCSQPPHMHSKQFLIGQTNTHHTQNEDHGSCVFKDAQVYNAHTKQGRSWAVQLLLSLGSGSWRLSMLDRTCHDRNQKPGFLLRNLRIITQIWI